MSCCPELDVDVPLLVVPDELFVLEMPVDPLLIVWPVPVLLPVLLLVLLPVLLLVLLPVLLLVLFDGIVVAVRGVKTRGILSPPWPRKEAPIVEVLDLFTSRTMTSTTTSAFGRSRSCINFSTRAIVSCEPRATIAF